MLKISRESEINLINVLIEQSLEIVDLNKFDITDEI